MTLTSDTIMPFLVLGVIGIGFCLAYWWKPKLLWWAIIPGLSAFTLLAAVLSEFVVGPNPKNDWVNVLVMGIGTAVIAAVLKRAAARYVLIIITMFMFLVAIAMAPLDIIPKVVLIAVDVLVGLFIASRAGGR